MHVTFYIDRAAFPVSTEGSPESSFGEDIVLSNESTDPLFGKPWYEKGYTSFTFLGKEEFSLLKEGLRSSLESILGNIGIKTDHFELEKYHEHITSEEQHQSVVSVTRDLLPGDFNFNYEEIIKKFSDFLGFKLSDTDHESGTRLHIIIRINRPGSTDFNPPHKDIYESMDSSIQLPPFVNFWIPVCGVTELSSLSFVPGSHLISESKILRTKEGGVIEGKKYRVRSVLEWDNSTSLIRSKVAYGEALVYSPYLIHGLGYNAETDITRVALQFKLFRI
jgi:hypothetical protein